MKKILVVISILVASLGATTTYVYVEKGVEFPALKDGTVLYSGTPLEVIKDGEYKVRGFVGKDKTKLYATKNLKLLLASSKHIKVKGDKGTLLVKMNKKDTESDYEEAWLSASDMFYNKCTKCHAAKVVGDHTMLEWEGLYGSTKQFAKPTKQEDELIVRFLQAFSKDGIELVKKIRKENKTLPIVITTAHTDTDHLLNAVEFRLEQYIVKPVSLKALKQALEKCVKAIGEFSSIEKELPDGFKYDSDNKSLTHDTKAVKLTKKEVALFELLLKNSHRVVSYNEI